MFAMRRDRDKAKREATVGGWEIEEMAAPHGLDIGATLKRASRINPRTGTFQVTPWCQSWPDVIEEELKFPNVRR